MNPFSTEGFLRRGECGDWSSALTWAENVGDLLLWSAFMVIPAILLFIAWKRKVDLRPFIWTLVLFAAFTVFCGNTHGTGFLMWLWPAWWVDALHRIAAGVVAWVAAVNLGWTIPRVLNAVSPRQIVDATKDLDKVYQEFRAKLDSTTKTQRVDALEEAVQRFTKLMKRVSSGD